MRALLVKVCHTMLSSIVIALVLAACASMEAEAQAVTEPHRVKRAIFTTRLTEENQPKNNLKKVSLDKEGIYIFVRWKLDLEKQKSFIVSYRVFDGSGSYVNSIGRAFFPRTEDWNSWYWVYFQRTQTPGNWRFEVYLDDRKMVEKYLKVLPRKKDAKRRKRKN